MKNTGLEYGVLTERLLQLQLMGLVEETTKGYYMRLEK
jgi:predicted Rossmann fold nucleotide-binding protein DprA/Smf involved in DNA uptake